MGIYDNRNRVIEHQKYYQKAYKNHVRIWNIHPRSKYYMIPYYIGVAGSTLSTFWMLGRKVLGHNTWWGEG
ncbi:hypothetical protein GGR56DRAFT_656074 [Xylariaceae sp. FL0804]|nr:hypothetical protein GGR56DRAFT_656074 [Xylariaceae sp. FL0804]